MYRKKNMVKEENARSLQCFPIFPPSRSWDRIFVSSKANPHYAFPKQALVFTCLLYKPIENTMGKGEISRNEQFLLFPQCFLPVW